VDIDVQSKIRTPCERLLADLGSREVDLYREEKAEGGRDRQRTRGFHATFTRLFSRAGDATFSPETPDRSPVTA